MRLAVFILAMEKFEHQSARDWLVLVALLLSIGLAGSRYLVFFNEPKREKLKGRD